MEIFIKIIINYIKKLSSNIKNWIKRNFKKIRVTKFNINVKKQYHLMKTTHNIETKTQLHIKCNKLDNCAISLCKSNTHPVMNKQTTER